MKISKNNITIFGLLFLTIFLPYYSFLRGLLLIYSPDYVSTFISFVRDAIIILIFVISISSFNIFNLKPERITFAVCILLCSLVFAFLITLIRYYPQIALQAAHLSIIPIFSFFSAKTAQKLNKSFYSKFLKLFFFVGISVSCLSIYFYFWRPQIYIDLFTRLYTVDGTSSNELAESYVRMIGPFFSPNVLGNYMAIISIITFVKLANPDSKKIYYFVFLISISNVILSLSRGSWLFLILGVTVILCFHRTSHRLLLKMSFLFILLISVVGSSLNLPANLNIYEALSMRFTSISAPKSDVYERFEKSSNVFAVVAKNPLGGGLGTGSQASTGKNEYIKEVGVGVIDGYYLKILAESGIIGLAAFLFSVALIVNTLIQKHKTYQLTRSVNFIEKKEFILIIIAIAIGTMGQSIGSNPLDYIATAPFFWIFLGISSEL